MLKTQYDILLEKFSNEGRLKVLTDEETAKILDPVEKDLENYRFENQRKIKDSQEDIASIILNS